MTAPTHDRPPRWPRRLLHALSVRLWPSWPAGTRVHPDGGPGPHGELYPWEQDSEALDPADARLVQHHTRQEFYGRRHQYVVATTPPDAPDLGGPEPVAVVATEQPDGTIIVSNPWSEHLPADWPEQMRRRFGADVGQPLRPQEWTEGGVVGTVQRPAVEPEDRRDYLRPGDPGYWEQFERGTG